MIELKAHSSDYISQFAPATETSCCDFSASAQMKEFETRISLPLCIAAEPTAPPGRESPAGAVLDGPQTRAPTPGQPHMEEKETPECLEYTEQRANGKCSSEVCNRERD